MRKDMARSTSAAKFGGSSRAPTYSLPAPVAIHAGIGADVAARQAVIMRQFLCHCLLPLRIAYCLFPVAYCPLPAAAAAAASIYAGSAGGAHVVTPKARGNDELDPGLLF
jgi:hypothetical protein